MRRVDTTRARDLFGFEAEVPLREGIVLHTAPETQDVPPLANGSAAPPSRVKLKSPGPLVRPKLLLTTLMIFRSQSAASS